MADSSQIRPHKSLLVIGGKSDIAGSANPKPHGVSGSTLRDSSKPGLKRDSRYYENGDANNLSIKKSRTTLASDPRSNSENSKKIVPLAVRPLTVVEADTPKLSRQFWKAGDDKEDEHVPRYCNNDAAVRVHPQFLHANATSHKWALGALAELLDNSLDEVCNGATYVHVDSTTNKKDDKSSILIIEDNGGGMNPSRFRECLSLGYSRKRNMANTVGQYGNGFKTSTMRLGADAIVFSRCRGTNGNNTTQSIGMLSYTYLYETRKCEAIVPTVDFELVDNKWKQITYNSNDEWFDNLETIVKWSPFLSQEELFDQFDSLEEQGTRILIYNLWEDDEGKLELDFDTDPHDIQLRGVNRDEKNIEMAKTYPNSRHFLSYRHSLRSYASILYLKLPANFRIILRGKDVEHHSLLHDMMMTEEKVYKPKSTPEECSPDQNLVASLKIGFVKDAHHHIDIQGFNVYHKNRLIKPFWRVWNAAGSDGRGVIGILEANFIQPAHNKQGFERTVVLAKLEKRLLEHQKAYWSSRCHEIGYARRRKQKNNESFDTETTRQPNQKSEAPSNYIHHIKGAFPSAAQPARSRQNVESSVGNRNSQANIQKSGVATEPDIGLKNGRHGLEKSFNDRGPAFNLVAELQKEKYESGKLVADLQRQKALLESQVMESKARINGLKKSQELKEESAKLVAELQRQKVLLKSQLNESKAKIQDLEKSQMMKDESATLVAELQRRKQLFEFQVKDSAAKIRDLVKSQKLKDDEKAKLVAELQRQRQQFDELQLKESKAKIMDLEKLQKAKDESAKLVTELLGQKQQLELQLMDSKNKIQDLEKSRKGEDESAKMVTELLRQKQLLELQLDESKVKFEVIFQEERTRRDLAEYDLRKRLQESSDTIAKLTKKVNSLEAGNAFCKKTHPNALNTVSKSRS